MLEVRGRRDIATARVLVNATGPWLKLFAANVLREAAPLPVRLDKGSHIVVPRLFEHDRGYIFQTRDARVVFALPFERDFTLIGTTDRGFAGDPGAVEPSADEIAYLCDVANQLFSHSADRPGAGGLVVCRRALALRRRLQALAGCYPRLRARARRRVRRGAAADRLRRQDHHLSAPGGACARSAFTYREMRPAMDRAARICRAANFPTTALRRLWRRRASRGPSSSEQHVRRLVHAYGTRVERVLGPARSCEELGPDLGADLTGAEVLYLMEREWAQTADDVLWRRSKLGLRFSREEREQLARFMAATIGARD